jgi:UDP-glucose 4-epimerase
MRVFVTGGAGYIGSVMTRVLLEDGHDVTVFDNLSQGHRAALPRGCRFQRGSLSDAVQLRRALRRAGPDCVMHFAASIQVGESVAHPGRYFENNVVNGVNLLNAIVEYGIPRLVFSSSAAVYGAPRRVPIPESAPLNPANPYGSTKRVFELLLEEYAKATKLSCVSLRYFNVVGAYKGAGEDHRPETHIVPLILKAAMAGHRPPAADRRVFEIYGDDFPTPDGTCIRDYVHVHDLCRAHLLAIKPPATIRKPMKPETLKPRHQVYNLGSQHGFSVKQVFAAARAVTGKRIPYRVTARRAGDVPRLVASSARIRTELGWRPRITSLEQMLADAWEWHQANPEGYAD